ncbi:MAG: peptide chain release factor-like protein [Deltaproteobacteria bacterium]|nr:peptide chain release factor-like protein [Deltaproteobacteria bacterium]
MNVRQKRSFFHPHEIRVETFKAPGPGGQHRNKRETAVRVRHLPSGITAISTEHRSQARNKELALRRLELKLRAMREKRKPRIPTSIPRTYKENILAAKRHRAQIKRWRKNVSPYEI